MGRSLFKDAMFLIAGVQPKTRRVDENPQRCPVCGLAQAYATRVDHYLSLFFIPLIRVRQGAPFLLCEGCQRPVDDSRAPVQAVPLSGSSSVCVACKRAFDSSFKYCPHCGQRS
jgi:RNA polymerase subunit RPABC4/transcription elongation factor Spt4